MVTSINPAIYQGFLCPILVFVLSDSNPTIGVMMPSVICPDRMAAGAASVTTTLVRK